MLDLLLPDHATKVVVYLEPINVRAGPDKLRSICVDTIGIEPDLNTAFVFTNKKRDALVLYALDHDGDRVLTKKLDKGGFLLPAPDEQGTNHVVLRPGMLAKLFR